jgi:uncharacterized protein YndB with AHSA1/START domain
VKVSVSSTCPASPEVVWEWIADPEKHIRMLPDEIRDGHVLDNGDVACELVAMGVRERMIVRVVEADPPRRLVAQRVDGNHATRVTLTSEVDLPRFLGAMAAGPVRAALEHQLQNLAALVATGE